MTARDVYAPSRLVLLQKPEFYKGLNFHLVYDMIITKCDNSFFVAKQAKFFANG